MESDFSVFYRIDDVSQLTGQFFFERAICLFSYSGALRTKLEVEMQERSKKEAEWKRRFSKGSNSGSNPRTTLGQEKSIDINGPRDASSSPELQGLIEFA